ncbi:MAG: hypothetical protein H8E37_02100 [Planctomycetes bacterium]|nr:hypothetical protein [Planctomycetota bacterium]
MSRIFAFSLLTGMALTTAGCSTAQRVGQAAADVPIAVGQWGGMKLELLEQRWLDEKAIHEARIGEMVAEREYMKLTREALVGEQNRKSELDLKRQSARAQLRDAEDEMIREATEPKMRNKLQSQLQLNYGQSLKVGQLQVDTGKLKKLLEEREKQNKELQDTFDAQQASQRSKLTDQLANCAVPGLDKANARSRLTEPPEIPVLPTEIPLMLPVNLSLEMDSPKFGTPQIKQIPVAQQCTSPRSPSTDAPENPRSRSTDIPSVPPTEPCCPSCAAPIATGSVCPKCIHKK